MEIKAPIVLDAIANFLAELEYLGLYDVRLPVDSRDAGGGAVNANQCQQVRQALLHGAPQGT